MKQNVVYVGIDVDDVHYHGSVLDRCSGEVLDFRCRPTLKGLVSRRLPLERDRRELEFSGILKMEGDSNEAISIHRNADHLDPEGSRCRDADQAVVSQTWHQ